MKTAIGVDIGGTKISMVLGTIRGRILSRREIQTCTGTNARPCLKELVHQLQELIHHSKVSKRNVAGIGIGIPGAVDTTKGVVPRSPHLGGWKGIPIVRIVSRALKLPVAIANDANAAALGEKYFGDGRHHQQFIYMTVSTGVGGGIVVNGELVEGSHYVAGEVGHMTIIPEGEPCKCGNKGCLEAYASGTAMARYAESQMRKGRSSKIRNLLSRGDILTGKILGLAARKRDRLALETYRRGGYFLGIGIANLLNILNPSCVMLGGGVLKSAPPDFLAAMRESCRKHAWPEAFRSVRIIRSKLGDQAGNLGALALAFDTFVKDSQNPHESHSKH